MIPELEHALKSHNQWFGSYKRSGELVNVQLWLTVNNGDIEFLTLDNSYKVKRVRRNPRVICYIGDDNGPPVPGTTEIVMGGLIGPIGKRIRRSWCLSRSQLEGESELASRFSFASIPTSRIPWPARQIR